MRRNIVVIGGGFGGLAAANRLAAKGHNVTLFDKRDKLGGRGYQYEINGFKFDGGPTVMTIPYLFDDIFAAAGKDRRDYFELVPLDPYYRIFDHEGRYFDYRARQEDALAEVERWSPEDVDGYRKLIAHSERIFNRFYVDTEKPYLHLTDMLPLMMPMVKLRAFLSAYRFVSGYIKNDFLRRVFSYHPLLIGGNPLTTPAIFLLITTVERKWGVHYAMGGTGAAVAGLGRLLEEQGAAIHLSTEVAEITVRDRRVTGVRLTDGTFVEADDVVCNGDVAFAYHHLIPAQHRRIYTDRRIDHMQYSMSLCVIYFGTKRRYLDSKLAHHNVILNQRYQGLLNDIFHHRGLPEDFSLYLHMPSITDPTIAPEGCESFYVLSPVSTLDSGVDWRTQARPYRDRIMQFLEDNYLPDLQANIIAEHWIDPLHFQNTLNSYRGAAFGIQPNLFQSGALRPHNRSEEFPNLYFVGAGTHPGAGVPAVLASGKIAAELIDPSPHAG